VLGAIAAALFMSYWTYGPDGPKSWVAAKFWNSPTIGPKSTAATTTAPDNEGKVVPVGGGNVGPASTLVNPQNPDDPQMFA
jgi:hypothetical protein